MKKLFSEKMTNTGGRGGNVSSPDGKLKMKVAMPGTAGAEDATNPEQLFAAGYSACFNSALELVMKREKINTPAVISVIVSLYEKAEFDFVIGVEIEGHIDGLPLEKTEELLEKAHQVCPYSKATRGNIEVALSAV